MKPCEWSIVSLCLAALFCCSSVLGCRYCGEDCPAVCSEPVYVSEGQKLIEVNLHSLLEITCNVKGDLSGIHTTVLKKQPGDKRLILHLSSQAYSGLSVAAQFSSLHTNWNGSQVVRNTNNTEISVTFYKNDTTLEDSGLYQCSYQESYFETQVKIKYAPTTARILINGSGNHQGSFTGYEGQILELSCTGDGYPRNYRWERLKDGGTTELSQEANLTLSLVSAEQNGVYTCTVCNDLGMMRSTSLELHTLVKPKLLSSPHTIIHWKHRSTTPTTLTSTFDLGYPESTILWTKVNESVLTPSSFASHAAILNLPANTFVPVKPDLIAESKAGSILTTAVTLSDKTAVHLGSYKVEARNGNGSQVATFTLVGYPYNVRVTVPSVGHTAQGVIMNVSASSVSGIDRWILSYNSTEKDQITETELPVPENIQTAGHWWQLVHFDKAFSRQQEVHLSVKAVAKDGFGVSEPSESDSFVTSDFAEAPVLPKIHNKYLDDNKPKPSTYETPIGSGVVHRGSAAILNAAPTSTLLCLSTLVALHTCA